MKIDMYKFEISQWYSLHNYVHQKLNYNILEISENIFIVIWRTSMCP